MNHEFDTFRQNQETSRVGMNHEFDTFRKNCVEENTQLLILIYIIQYEQVKSDNISLLKNYLLYYCPVL